MLDETVTPSRAFQRTNGHKRNDVFMQAQGDGRAMQLKRVNSQQQDGTARKVQLKPSSASSMQFLVLLNSCHIVPATVRQ